MSLGKRVAAGAVVLVLAMVLMVGASFALAAHQVGQANARWCATLTLLTAKPVPKPASSAATPARAGQYQLYMDFVKLRAEFGCR